MLTGGLDPLYRAALTGSHTAFSRVEVWRGSERLISDLPFSAGSVSANLNSRVTRSLNITVDEQFTPVNADDLLAPIVNSLRVFRGIRLGDNREFTFPVFRGRIRTAVVNSNGTVDLSADDRAQDVIDVGFTNPRTSDIGVRVDAQFQSLVLDAVSDASFGVSDSFYQLMPLLTWEYDRGRALDEISTAVGAFWWVLADGQYVIRRVPWTVSSDPIITLSDSDNAINPLISNSRYTLTRDNVFNSVTAYGERTDGTTPVWATAQDTDPNSLTYVGGPFGVRHKLLRLQTPTNQGAALTAARDYLRRSIALTETWTWNQTPDPSLELGDVVSLNARKRTNVVQVINQFTMPLNVNGTQSVSSRSQVVGALE